MYRGNSYCVIVGKTRLYIRYNSFSTDNFDRIRIKCHKDNSYNFNNFLVEIELFTLAILSACIVRI